MATFESGWGVWNDGGSDCYRIYDKSKTNDNSSYSIRLRDNSNRYSSMYTDKLNLAGLSNVDIDFEYHSLNLLSGHTLYLEYSLNNGLTYQKIKELKFGLALSKNMN